MRKRIAENSEMSGQTYFQEEAAKEHALRNGDQDKIPQYAEFEVNKPASDRLPLNQSQTRLNGSDRSGETMSTEDTMGGGYARVGLPSGPSPYHNGGNGYPPTRMPRPYGAVPPVRTPSDRDRQYPPSMPQSRSNVSLNSMNRQPRSGYDVPPPMPVAPADLNRHASSVYSEYIPARRDWGAAGAAGAAVAGIAGARMQDEDYLDQNQRYRPSRPKIDTYNLDNPYMTRRSQELDMSPQQIQPQSALAPPPDPAKTQTQAPSSHPTTKTSTHVSTTPSKTNAHPP